MKLVLGIDLYQRWEAAARMIGRLGLRDAEIHLVHALEPYETLGLPVRMPADSLPPGEPGEGDEALRAAEAMLKDAAAAIRSHRLRADPAYALMKVADEVDADLIAVGSERKGPFGGLFFGSVGRGLVIGSHRSVLVCKELAEAEGPLKAVLATDHSDYMSGCVERLLELAPAGIGRITVMTANRMSPASQALLVWDVPAKYDDAAVWVREKLEEETAEECGKLAPLGAVCTPIVIDSHPVEAIASVMAADGADLLILGAQGHSFVERLSVGSISLNEVVATPHNVLVLRKR